METMMSTSEFREKCFTPTSMPSEQALKNSIKRGNIKGRKIGQTYYIFIEQFFNKTPQKIECNVEEDIQPNFSRFMKKGNQNA